MISETSNLRLPDVDLERQRLLVRLPIKTATERRVPFHEKTKRYLKEWLKVRDCSCSRDFLFHNTPGKPMNGNTLWRHLPKIFDGDRTKRRPTYDEVFDGSTYHRLRYSLGSSLANHGMDIKTPMVVGAWRSFGGMKSYIKLNTETVENSYPEAMEEARRSAKKEPSSEIMLEEFAAQGHEESHKEQILKE